MAQADEPETVESPSFAEMLRVAMKNAGLNKMQLGNRLAEATNTQKQSKRRLVQKYLAGTVAYPEDDSLAVLTEALGVPEDYFEAARPSKPLPEGEQILVAIREIHDLLLDVRARLR